VLQQTIDWLQDYGTAYEKWLLHIELGALLPSWREDEYAALASSPTEGEQPAEPIFDMDPGEESPDPQRFGWRAAYGGVMRYLDDLFGQFTKLLEELQLVDECLIIVQSPLGQPLGEYGPVTERNTGIFEERCHLPLLIKFPNGAGAGRRVHHFTTPSDVLATVFQMLLGDPCESLRADHLVRYTAAQAARFREYAVTTIPEEHGIIEATLRTNYWSLTTPFTSITGKPIQLYRKPEDRWEMNNVAKEHVEVAEHLELTLHRYLHWLAGGAEGDAPSLRNEVVQVLAQ
jgi:arylsulfatase A-like enzyme